MNKQCFRVIFSKTLQRLVVTSELAKSEGKSTEKSPFTFPQLFANIRPLTFSLFCALGFVAFSDSALANLIIQADKSAPKSQQPIVLQTANGLPQVNIQTPNNNGLSHNKYSKFDVDTKGAILNNSRTNVQTQQAGMVTGNPYLARGEAKVILNEVNSSDPSVLKGYVEVAGKKADVIIANPSGLHCEGCGIINSDRATFTTGKPQIVNGNLESFVVEKGKVSVSGKGLDNSRVDYTEIIARETQASAGIWSKKEAKVIIGKNTVKRLDAEKDLQIIQANQPLAGEVKPQFAVDVGELGGMYSGKIYLIGTEEGVGVRNAGHIGASAETLRIDSQGRIVNTGTLNAQQEVKLAGSKGIENRGKVENRQGDITLNTPADIKQDGSIVARAGNIHKTAQQGITQNGETVAKGNITYKAPTVTASTSTLIATGVDVKDTAQGEVRTLESKSAQGKNISVTTSGKATLQGKNMASGEINVSSSDANLDSSQTSVYSINVTASQGKIQANNATVVADKDLTLTTPTALETKDSYLKAESINTKQRSLNTQNATWEQTGTSELTLEVTDTLQNNGGTFKTQGDLSVKANELNNQQGRLLANGKLSVDASKGKVDSTNGTLYAPDALTITSGKLINDSGLIQSNQNVTINTQGQTLSNKQTLTSVQDKGIVALGTLDIQSANLTNQQGRIVSGGKQSLTVTDLNNQQGLVYTQQDLTLNSANITNDSGKIKADKQADITLSGHLSQQSGAIEAHLLNLAVNTLNSTVQSLIFADTLNITTSGGLNNQDSRIIAKFDGNIQTGNTVNNTNGTLGSQQGSLTINTYNQGLVNEKGNIVAAKHIRIGSGALENNQGLISADDIALNSHNQTINNQDTLSANRDKGIIAQHSLTLETASLNNDRGHILSHSNTLNTTSLTNHRGKIRTQSQLDLNTHTLTQNAGLIAAHVVNLVADAIQSTQQSEISGSQVKVSTQTLDNKDSKLITRQTATIDVQQGIQNQNGTLASLGEALTINTHKSDLNNTNGMVSVQNGVLKVDTATLDNQQGTVLAKTAEITAFQRVDNRNTLANNTQGILVTDLTLNTKQLDNQAGRLTAFSHATLQATDIQNQNGEILAVNDGQLNADNINNQAGTIASTSDNLSVSTQTTLNNQQGTLSAADKLTLNTSGLENQHGNVTSSNQLILNTAQQQINNQGGTLFANHQVEINAGEINNQQGLIRADKLLSIQTNQHTIDNRHTQGQNQGIIGLGQVVLSGVDTLLNQQGKLYAENMLEATIKQTTNNTQGLIQSNGSLALVTQILDNQAGKITAVDTANISAQAINNKAISEQGSLIYANSLNLTTQQLDNQNTKAKGELPTQGIQGQDITLQTAVLNNQQGGIYSTNNVSLTAQTRLDNQQGELLALNTVNVQHQDNLMLNNQDGLIQGNKAVNLQAKGLESEGTIKTLGDLAVTLQDSFTLNKAFEAGNNLTFKTEGDFTNNVEQTVANKMTISANNIVNNVNAKLSAHDTTLNSNTLTNRGLIDGHKALINSTRVTNIGTGRIYGDHLAFSANTVENLAETLNGETKAGTIAARSRLDFGVDKLINRDHALILSLDKLFIEGKLDANNQATGQASLVDNGSATIEALGDGAIHTVRLLNHDLYIKTGIKTDKQYFKEYTPEKSSDIYLGKGGENAQGYLDWNNNSRRDRNAYFRFSNGTSVGSPTWFQKFYTRTTNTATLDHQDPAKISIGGNLSLSGEKLTNEYSRFLIGKQLLLGDQIFDSNPNNLNLTTSSTKLENIDLMGEIHRLDQGETSTLISKRVRHGIRGRRVWAHYTENINKNFSRTLPVETFGFKLVLNTIGTPVSSNANVEVQPKVKDIKLDTVSIITPKTDKIGELSVTQPQVALSEKTQITLKPEIDNDNIISSGQVVATLNKTIDSPEKIDLSNMKMPVIKTHLPDVALPQASLYKINPDSLNGYLVETDPKFTDRKQWLSSDYMFEALRYNHDNTHKRLGDGFYEQRLVNEQINQLTGRRYIEGYSNDLEQYKALMNSGVKYAKQFNLTVGIGLTAKQMSELTTDMVWLVNKYVTLADGRKISVLTPQVYLVARDSDITSHGAVISANQIIGNVDNLQNSGVIAGKDITRLHTNQLENRGAILGDSVDLSATQNLINLGGKIEAVKSLSLSAGKNLEIASTLSSSQSADGNFARTVLDQLSTIKVTGEGGALNLHSDGNLTIKAAHIESNGTASATAKDTLQITTLNVSNKEHYNSDANNYYRLGQQGEIGSSIMGKGGVSLVGQHEATLRQVTVSSANGDTFIGSKGDVRIEAGEQAEQLASSSKSTSKGVFSKTTETRRYYHDTTEAVGSEIDGKNVTVYSKDGKVDIHGSAVVADDHLLIDGKQGVNITSATNTRYVEDETTKTKSGLMGSGGIGFTIGSKKEDINTDNRQKSAVASRVGSLSGNTTIQTKGHYQQTGSIVTSRDGDIDITAKTANVTAARNDYESNYKRTYEQKGVTVAANIPVVQAAQAVQSAVNSAKAVGSSKNDRINALAAANAGFEAMRAAEQMANVANTLKDVANVAQGAASGVSVSITYGEQKSVETQHSQGNTVAKSQINAGGKVNIHTQGAGKDSTITIAGSDVSGKAGTKLSAEGGVNVVAVDENHLERSKNSASGFNTGVAVSYGSGGFAMGVTAGGNVAKGYGNGESQAWVGGRVGSQNSKTEIESGSTINIIGSQAVGKRVEVKAQDLNIESVQDTMKYEGKQESISGQVTVGYGVSGSASYSNSKVKADYASVKQQAGIFAGDEGYDVNVANHTDLKAGLITSTDKAEAEGKNRFSTGTITRKDLDNHANHKGSAISVSGSASANFDTFLGDKGQVQSNKQATNDKGQKIYIDSNGNETTDAGTKESPNTAKLATGIASLQTGSSLGYGSDSESTSSTTKAGINTKNIEIRNKEAQQQLTGRSVEETLQAIKTETNTDNAESLSGKLDNTFDKNKLQKELDYQVKATTELQTITKPTIDEKIASHAESKREEANQAKLEGNQAKATQLEQEAKEWEMGGKYKQAVDAVTNAVVLFLGSNGTEGIVVGAASPYVNSQIKEATKGNKGANLVAHAIWGAVEAYSQGEKAGTGAIAAVTGEVGAKIIAESLYGKSPENLTEAEKRTVSELSQVAAGLASGLTVGGDSHIAVTSAQTGKTVAENAVENNALTNKYSYELLDKKEKALSDKLTAHGVKDVDQFEEAFNKAQTKEERDKIIAEYKIAVDEANQIIADLYKQGIFTDEDYSLYITSYSQKMLEGAKRGQSENNGKSQLNFWQSLSESDPYLFYGTEWFVGNQLNNQSLQSVRNQYWDKQVEKGVITPAEKEVILAKDLAYALHLPDAPPDAVKTFVKALLSDDIATLQMLTRTKISIVKNSTVEDIKSTCDTACFIAGTLVETIDGLKPIEQIKYGELVWSRQEFGNDYGYKPVFANKVTEYQETFEVIVENSESTQETFITTAEHPFFTQDYGWRKSALLAEGDILLDRNGSPTLKVKSQKPTGRLETVYNIKVEEFSTYHIGNLGVWVHNARCCDFVNNKYGDVEVKLREGGWVNNDNKVMYIDPFDGKFKEFPDGAKASIDHIYPQSAFNRIEGFSELPKSVQNELINHPYNLQPLPKELNSSKGAKIETGTEGWSMYVKDSKNVSPEYSQYLFERQREMERIVNDVIKSYKNKD